MLLTYRAKVCKHSLRPGTWFCILLFSTPWKLILCPRLDHIWLLQRYWFLETRICLEYSSHVSVLDFFPSLLRKHAWIAQSNCQIQSAANNKTNGTTASPISVIVILSPKHSSLQLTFLSVSNFPSMGIMVICWTSKWQAVQKADFKDVPWNSDNYKNAILNSTLKNFN